MKRDFGIKCFYHDLETHACNDPTRYREYCIPDEEQLCCQDSRDAIARRAVSKSTGQRTLL